MPPDDRRILFEDAKHGLRITSRNIEWMGTAIMLADIRTVAIDRHAGTRPAGVLFLIFGAFIELAGWLPRIWADFPRDVFPVEPLVVLGAIFIFPGLLLLGRQSWSVRVGTTSRGEVEVLRSRDQQLAGQLHRCLREALETRPGEVMNVTVHGQVASIGGSGHTVVQRLQAVEPVPTVPAPSAVEQQVHVPEGSGAGIRPRPSRGSDLTKEELAVYLEKMREKQLLQG